MSGSSLSRVLACGRILYTKEWVRVTDTPGHPHVGADYRDVRRLRAKSLQPACHRLATGGAEPFRRPSSYFIRGDPYRYG
jgi:hypothetical protein